MSGQVCDGSKEESDMEDRCRRRVSDGTENDSDMEGLSRRKVCDGTEQASDSGGLRRKNTEDLREKGPAITEKILPCFTQVFSTFFWFYVKTV